MCIHLTVESREKLRSKIKCVQQLTKHKNSGRFLFLKNIKMYKKNTRSFGDQADRAMSECTNKQPHCYLEIARVTLRELRTELPDSRFTLLITQWSCELMSLDEGLRNKLLTISFWHAIYKMCCFSLNTFLNIKLSSFWITRLSSVDNAGCVWETWFWTFVIHKS